MNYNAKEFLQKADEYYKNCDFIQAHEKLWASASYSIKRFFLLLGVKLASHNAKSFAVDVIINEVKFT